MAFPLFLAGVAGLVALGTAALSLTDDEKNKIKKKDDGITRAKVTGYNQKHVDEVFEDYEANGFDDRAEAEEEIRRYNERLKEQRSTQQIVLDGKNDIKTEVKTDQEKAKRLKDILCDIREVAGFTVDELSARIDVTRQTVYNWERKEDSKLSVPHYYAIMHILAFNKKANLRVAHDNILSALQILVENPEEYPPEYVLETRRRLKNLANELRNPHTSAEYLKQESTPINKWGKWEDV